MIEKESLKVAPSKAKSVIDRQIVMAESEDPEYIDFGTITKLENSVTRIFTSVFKNPTELINDFKNEGRYTQEPHNIYLIKISFLNTLSSVLTLFDDDTETADLTDQIKINNSKTIIFSRNIFVVHGHNDGIKEKVARFLEKVELKPIILHEQPNSGHTVIEKFEKYSDVGFAVVILSGDDEAHSKNNPDDKEIRARQNVIFELGYFIGRLGRNKVCALKDKEVVEPSDISGVLYINSEGENWKLTLAKEINSAGIKIDFNLLSN